MVREISEITLTKEECERLMLLVEEAAASTSDATSTKPPLIRRVTHTLCARYNKEERKRYFEPISVAIGPLHHEKDPKPDSPFKGGEKFKLQLAATFIEYWGRKQFEDFYKNVKKEINSLKKCYDPNEVEKWNDEELTWTFLVDGCALLHFIVLDVKDKLKELGGKNDLIASAKLDLFLLENQLPYQLLEILIGSCTRVPSAEGANPQKELKDSITEFINKSFLSLVVQQHDQIQVYSQTHDPPDESQQQKEPSAHPPAEQQQHVIIHVDSERTHPPHEQRQEEEEEPAYLLMCKKSSLCPAKQQQIEIEVDSEGEPAHLLALLRKRLIGDKSRRKDENQKQDKESTWQQCNGLWSKLMNSKLCSGDKSKHGPTFRSVKELRAKGIHFKAKENIVGITDIDFNKDRCFCLPTLTLAPILVDDATMPKLLNLIAYEMCPDFKNEYEITSYVSFLDSLIDSGQDVKELRDARVLHNRLGSDEAVAKLFNRITDNLVPNLEIHKDLKKRIQEHYNFKLASDFALFCHTYFRSPWSFFVFIGVIAGLLMTALETYNSFNEDKPAAVVNNNYYYYHP